MEDKKSFIVNVIYYALIFAVAYLFCNYLFGILAPFLLGVVFAYLAVRLTKKIFKKETKILRVISLVILYVIVFAIIVVLVILGINELIDFIGTIPSLYRQYVEPVLENLALNADNNLRIPADVQNDLYSIRQDLLDSIKSAISSISSAIVSSGTNLISNTTNIIISILTTLITSFFVVYEYEDILNYLEKLFNGVTRGLYSEIKNYFVNTVFSVIKSYGLIMGITFIELFIGLMILGVSNFALIAMIIAFLDILPVLGVGTVLLPWAVFKFVISDFAIGIGLLVLYGVITVVRNIVEPKLVGASLGLHPLATLFSMLMGLELFGVLGMFGCPLLVSFLAKRETK